MQRLRILLNRKVSKKIFSLSSTIYKIFYRNPFVFDDNHLGYVNTTKRCLEFLNIKTLKFDTNLIQASLPTELALPIQDTTEDKLANLYRDGMQLAYLPESGFVVVLECKMSYNSNLTDNIVTVFHKNQQGKHYKQVSFNQTANKMLYLSACNNKDLIAVYGQSFLEQPIQFFLWKVTSDP